MKIINLSFFTGPLFGLRTPFLLVTLQVSKNLHDNPTSTNLASEKLGKILRQSNINLDAESAHDIDSILALFFYLTLAICKAANYPVFEQGRVVGNRKGNPQLAIPVYGQQYDAVASLLFWLANTIDARCDDESLSKATTEFQKIYENLSQTGVLGSNSPRFLKAAFESDIPAIPIAGNVIQYGVGSGAHWLDSSITEETPALGVNLARNKHQAALVLKQSGLPVPNQRLPRSAEEAAELAHQMGYPVVIKPANKDGGLAVASGLMSAAEVKSAYISARKESKKVLLEQHIKGRDYRINIFRNKVLWAIERIPAGITGDGKSGIRQLVDLLNADPRRGEGIKSSLKKIQLDDEARAALGANNMNFDSVPAEGKFVPLRRKANIAAGGTPISVMDKMHPDNAMLAISAARVLRLDLAGVDLLLPDITQSWKVTGGAICEVNGQPQLGGVTSAHVYKEILQGILTGAGRIPIALVLGAESDSLVNSICAALHNRGLVTGCTNSDGIYINESKVSEEINGMYNAGQLLIRERTINAMVLSINDFSCLKTGLPIDRFDLLIVAGKMLGSGSKARNRGYEANVMEMVKMILPNCSNTVFVAGCISQDVLPHVRDTNDTLKIQIGSEKDWPELIADQMVRPGTEYVSQRQAFHLP